MTYHIIIDTGNTIIQPNDKSDSINETAKRLKSGELIYLGEEVSDGISVKNLKQPFGSNLYINPTTKEPYYPLFSISLLDAISLSIDKIGITKESNADDLPTTAVLVKLTDDNSNVLSEFDSVVVASRRVADNNGKENWTFRTFHSSIDTVTIAAEMSKTNHFITIFEKREIEISYLNILNDVVSEFFKNSGS